MIRSHNSINGIVLPEQKLTFKIVQHADDMSIFVTRNNEFSVLKGILYTYSEGSGSKINVEKSQGLWLGAWRNRKDNPCNFQWTNEKIKILGIYFGFRVKPEDNWIEKINKIKNVLNRWKERNLTLKGKAVIVNSLIGGILAYYGSVLVCPEYLIKNMNDAIIKFYWYGKPEQIKSHYTRSCRYGRNGSHKC